MEDKKINYEEWCIGYYEEHEDGWAENKKRMIENVEEKLTSRINCFTGKNYGNKRLENRQIKFLPEEEFLKLTSKRFDVRDGLIVKKNKYEEDIEKLDKKKGKILDDELDDMKNKKQNKIDELEYKIDKMYQRECDAPLGEEKRFKELTREEVELFELLLNKIGQKELKGLKKYQWEILDRADRARMLYLLQYVAELEHWDLTEEDVEDIWNKLIDPYWYRQCKLHTMLSEIEIYEWEEEIKQKYLELQDLSDELLLILMKKQEEKNKREDIRTEKKNEKKSD